AQGLGDISLYLGHETFQERTYSSWRPKGVSFLQITLPTSPSIYDASATAATEVRGRGFYSLGAGVALTKAWRIWDVHMSTEIHRSFARQFSGAAYGGEMEVQPGWGGSQTWGLGWNRGSFRLGSALTFLYEEPMTIKTEMNSSQASLQKNYTVGVSASYMPSMESSVTLSYSDQSWIGDPVNSSLSQTLQLSYQQRWPR
ncbi:MAG: serine protease spb1, partial [Bdellovibrio sp.]